MKKIKTVRLKTPFEGAENAWDIYPRPQMQRDSFFSLNGNWKLFSVRKNKKTSLGTITVPFPPESALSGIEKTPKNHEKASKSPQNQHKNYSRSGQKWSNDIGALSDAEIF